MSSPVPTRAQRNRTSAESGATAKPEIDVERDHRGESRKGATALVVGANGVIGRNLVEHLVSLPDWEVIGVSRRGGEDTDRVRYLAVDLMDAQDTWEKLSGLTGVTHLFYAAYQDRPTWAGLVPPNMAMLTNVVDAVEAAAPGLSHISLMQGYKVYGAHLGPFKTPARETDARPMPPEFMAAQQEFLEQRQQGKRWTWTALRPSVVAGVALGNPMNLALVIAVYAAISKELGLPLRFPGKPGAYDSLLEMTDARLLAKATVWAATAEQAQNQAFNINNGDLFRWREMWPKIAAHFGLPVGDPLPMSLTEVMADKAELWQRMVAEYDLEPVSYQEVSSWGFGDFVFSWDYDVFADGSKARRSGFHEFVDTEEMFRKVFDDLRERRIIP
ncbi:Nucleoside-diphosphate-sugar epimerase [Saccharopolyspora kobensis]|uniref:Nucleoside-diphosphate-sugar epimerase n=1 Tax=Saccharopolyspora kobensis TaxID=146035 RepID=A0A1H6E5P4_9PSEU|nr:SDR family oxidoreductase [Saccharopolyspora kobensis]SEG92601.1 Nucleoside-diphosphate-sugar epimerase [Saccharopolyspora kobensis]SFD39226.1 Nucleoside-diphosphate-sugar epimerase [Saccharopolyspora kobensis]